MDGRTMLKPGRHPPLHSTPAHPPQLPTHPPAVFVNAGKQPLVTSTVVLVLLPLPLMIPFPRTPAAVAAAEVKARAYREWGSPQTAPLVCMGRPAQLPGATTGASLTLCC